MKNFVLIGSAGYIAHKHLGAIKDTGNELIASLDKSDSVGVIDSYFPQSHFFTEFERFDRYLEKLKREDGTSIDYVSICSPNYLHDAHVRFALRIGATAVCEKPLVLNPWNIDALQKIEDESSGKVHCILQLRLHPSIIALKEKIDNDTSGKIHDIDLTYITPRGRWYMVSWKGDIHKSGGVTTNIGVHFFDMLSWIFGPVTESRVHLLESKRAAGFLGLQKARVRWFLSLNREDLPNQPAETEYQTHRSITVDGTELEFSGGFRDLHTESYRQILAGNGFSAQDAAASVQIVSEIRNSQPSGLKGDYHPFLKNIMDNGE